MTLLNIQRTITICLAVILIVIVGGYIYYGMQMAKKGEVSAVVDPVVVSTSTPTSNPNGKSVEEKMAILQALAPRSDATTTVSLSEREKVLNSLTPASSTPTMSANDKRKILEQLRNK